ncbi:MAG TPA: hypothetical protein VK808_05655 [Bacteroidia bacterium]|jgi:hypothetical protein|nr:hypothetical protein [Bacteroidia bacterium]
MKNNNVFVIIACCIAVMAFSGCTPQMKLQRLENMHPELFKPIVKDSISNTIQYVTRDSIINIPSNSVTLHDTFLVNKPCPAHYHKVIKADNETATLNIDSGRITVICHDDSLKQEIVIRDKIISSFNEHVQVGVAENDIYKTHWYDYFCRTMVILGVLVLILWIILHSYKLPLP